MAETPPEKVALPAMQAKALWAVSDFRKKNNHGPTHEEIAIKIERPKTRNVTPYIRPLIKRGFLTKSIGSRSLDVTWAGNAWLAANWPAEPQLDLALPPPPPPDVGP